MIERSARPGWVVWITGLPASGKTTLAKLLVAELRARAVPTVLLDGDVLRHVFEHDLGYSLDDRRQCGRRYARLSCMLAEQGLQVVIATISMFEEVRRWNRAHAPRYLEIYVRAPLEIRRARDRHGLYLGRTVVGGDLPFEEPVAPDLVVENDGGVLPERVAARLWLDVRRRLLIDED